MSDLHDWIDRVEALRDERMARQVRYGTSAWRRKQGEGEAYRLVLQLLTDGPPQPSMTSPEGHDPATLNELSRLIAGDGHVRFSVRYGAAARILNAGWRPPAPDNGGEDE